MWACAPEVEIPVWINVRVRRWRTFECSDLGVLSLLAALAQVDCSLQRSAGEHAKTSCAAAKWLGVVTMVVLPMAGSVSTNLAARVHDLWSVGSMRAGCRRGTMLHHQLCWNTRGMRSAEHGYVARRV